MLSKSEAAKALLLRRRARTHILDYARAIDIPGKPFSEDPDEAFFNPIETTMAQHHRLLLEHLDRISQTPYGRLIVLMPPGSAKSAYASVVFPTYFLGKNRGKRIILACYGDDLAKKLGRRGRSILRQKRYERIMRTTLQEDSQAIQDFRLTNGSEFMSCGILAGVTGNRADGLIIDDPVKGREQADSKTVRDKTREAYEDDLKTRLVPGGWVCLIQTRWHGSDLAGGILPKEWAGESGDLLCRDGHVWTVLCLPAKCEREDDPLGRRIGEYLWPEWFDAKHWAQFEINPRTWSALYQQRPSPPSGSLFQRSWWQYYSVVPNLLAIFQVWDCGVKEGAEHDPSCCLTIGLHRAGWYVLDRWSDTVEYPELERQAKILFEKWEGRGCSQVLIEDASSGSSLIQSLRKNTRLPVKGVRHVNKILPAYAISPVVEAGKVFLPEGQPWVADFVEQFAIFPNGSHDEDVDCLSFGIQQGPKIQPEPETEPEPVLNYTRHASRIQHGRANPDQDDIRWNGGRR